MAQDGRCALPMSEGDMLDEGRRTFGRRAWAEAYDRLSAADRRVALGADDLERLATAAYLTGHDAASSDAWTRAHQARLDAGDPEGAVRCAFWLGFGFVQRGEVAQGGGTRTTKGHYDVPMRDCTVMLDNDVIIDREFFLHDIAASRVHAEGLQRIVHESVPVLLVAGFVSAGAGVTLEKSFARFEALPALLVLVPAHLSSSGALGGILSGRLASKLFLGLVQPTARPNLEARRDVSLAFLLAVPVYLVNGIGAHVVARLLGQASPGLGYMVLLSLVGGALAILVVVAVAYYVTVAAYRTGVDPDTYGIPIVSSSVDLVGAFTLVIGMSLLGLP